VPLNPATLGAQIVAASGSIDAAGIAAQILIAAQFVTWTLSNIIVNATGGTPLVAVGPAITGTGGLIVGPTPILGIQLAAAAGSVDAAGLSKWAAIASEYGNWLSQGGIDPSTLIAYVGVTPPTGAVTGTALLHFNGPPNFAQAIGITDSTGAARWKAIAAAVQTHMQLALMTPAMINPGTGGPVTGTGTIA